MAPRSVPGSLWALAGLALAACATAPPSAKSRAANSAAAEPRDDVAWIEVTILAEALVKAEAADRATRMGHDPALAARRAEETWVALHGKAEGGPVLEVWLSTTCEECLDLRRWGWSLAGRRDGIAHRPRWTESEVMHQVEEVRSVLDASRKLTRSWVRGRLAFGRADLPTDGRVDLVMARPEPWAAPLSVTWLRGRLEPLERAQAWLTGHSP